MTDISNLGPPRLSRLRTIAHHAARSLESRRLPILLAGLTILLTLPSLWSGFAADDYFHRLRFVGSPKLPEFPADPSQLFTFDDGVPEHTRRLMDRGLWPWWTLETIHAAFWRPVTILTHRLDYWLWPDQPMLMHAQSILWLALVNAVTAILYRRLLGQTVVAGLAALLYTIDDARGMPVGFLANRNAMVATFFGMAALIAHHHWRIRRSHWAALFAPLLFLVSLLSAEAGLGTLAYILAMSAFLEKGTWRRRLGGVWPYLVVVVLWRIAWQVTGHGIKGVGLYVDPMADPARFLVEAIIRAPILLLGQFGFPPADTYMAALLLDWVFLLWIPAVVFLALLARRLVPLVRSHVESRFMAAGLLMALAPICATFASDRLLFFVGFGAFGLLARFLVEIRRVPVPSIGARRWYKFLIVVHLGLAPVGLLIRSAMPVGPQAFMEAMLVNVPMDERVERQTVILVTAPVAFATTYLPVNRALAGQPVPQRVRMLAPHQGPVLIRRTDAHTLSIRPKGGYLKNPLDQLARDLSTPFRLHEKVVLAGMTAEIAELTLDGRPAEVVFRFEKPLEDESYLWLAWRNDWRDFGYESFSVPSVGDTVSLQ